MSAEIKFILREDSKAPVQLATMRGDSVIVPRIGETVEFPGCNPVLVYGVNHGLTQFGQVISVICKRVV